MESKAQPKKLIWHRCSSKHYMTELFVQYVYTVQQNDFGEWWCVCNGQRLTQEKFAKVDHAKAFCESDYETKPAATAG